MVRVYFLGFLIPPTLMLALGWVLLGAGYMNGVEVLAFIAAPAIVMVLGWAALVANTIVNRRSDGRQQLPIGLNKESLPFVLGPTILLLLGWSGWQAGSISEEVFILCIVGPAGAVLMIGIPLVASEIASKWLKRRQRQG